MATPLLERRNERARALGWTSYGQQRYWTARFAIDKEGTAKGLARRICHGHLEPAREGSWFCKSCDLLVNGDGRSYAPKGTRRGDWRARLVNVALHRG